ncbi:MAG: RluA family pseudouridine synthase [Lewinellaceae bacterium]|nr:RluA family pseudouridine synthase [Saprospiraceae bacterium]MCB9311393.1 RluA family pseudouridine synthase [Lewinellaceae bacterium]
MNRLLKDIQVLFQDDDLLVVNKPPRLLTLPDRYAADKPSLIQALKEKDPGIMVNHRLDKDTSGVIVFTRNPEAHAQLSRQFDQRTLTKTYLALVKGVVASDEGVIDQPIAAHPSEDGRMRIWKGGKPSRSSYRVLERFRHYSWLEVTIDTGRTHQIRVHCAFIGHPLAVDPLYGSDEGVYLSSFKHNYRDNRQTSEQPLIDRLSLHAWKISFAHPRTGDPVVVEAPLPKDLRAVINQLQKWG